MFCGNCGRPIPEGQQNCQFCNPPAQQPAQEPVQTTYIPPVQDQTPVQPDFELNMPAEGTVRKKKGGNKTFLIIVALLAVVGIVLAAFNWGSIVRFFKRSFAEPAVYLQDVEKSHVADTAKTIATNYDKALDRYYPEGSSTDTTVTVEVGDQLMSLLNTALSQSGVDLDLSWIDSITIAPKVDVYKNVQRTDLGLGINGTHLVTASVIMDMDNQLIYIGLPELHDTYLQLDLAELYGEDMSAMMAENMAMSPELTQRLMEAMPTGEQIEELINTYFGILLDEMTDVEKATETVKLDGLEQDLLVMTAKLSQKDVLKIAEKILKEARKDKTIEDILDSMELYMNEMSEGYSESYDLHDMFVETVDEALAELESVMEEAEGGKFLTIETFLDSKDNVAGRAITISVDDTKVKGHYITVTEGNKFAFEAELATVEISGEGTIKDGKRTGSYTLTVADTDYVTVEIEDYACTEGGMVSGTIRVIPEPIVYEMMDMDSTVAAILGQAAFELTINSDTVILGIETAGSKLISFEVSGQSTKPSPIALPESIGADNEAAAMKWLSEMDIASVVSKLDKIGLPDEYMTLVDQFVTMFKAQVH